MGCLNVLLNLFLIFGILFFICYPIGAVLSRGPLGWVAWLIAFWLAIQIIKFINNIGRE